MLLPISVLFPWYQPVLTAFCAVGLGLFVSAVYSADIPILDDDLLAQALEAIALEESLESEAISSTDPFFEHNQFEPADIAPGINKNFENKIIAFEKLAPILNRIYTCKTETDVHQLDGFVNEKTQELLNIGEILGVGDDNLSLSQTQDQLRTFLINNQKEVTTCIIELNFQDILKHVSTHFGQMDEEVMVHPNHQQIKQIFSRLWTGARDVWINSGYIDFMPFSYMIMQICDNYTTGGGCLAGRIDRGFLAYTNLLNHVIND